MSARSNRPLKLGAGRAQLAVFEVEMKSLSREGRRSDNEN